MNGAEMMLATMVKVKNTITSTSRTNNGQTMYCRKLSQSGRLGISRSTQWLNCCIAKPISRANTSRLRVRDQHEQAQAGTHDQLQAFAEVLRAAQGWHREWFSDGMRAETLADWRKPATEPV